MYVYSEINFLNNLLQCYLLVIQCLLVSVLYHYINNINLSINLLINYYYYQLINNNNLIDNSNNSIGAYTHFP